MTAHDDPDTAETPERAAPHASGERDDADEAFFKALMSTPKGPARDALIAKEKASRRYRRDQASASPGIVHGDAAPRWLTWLALAFIVVAVGTWWWQR